MSSKIHFNPKRDIPYLAATIQAVIFAYSGSLLIGWIGWLIGGLMGVLVSVSVLYASSQYAETAKTRKPWVIVGIVILMLFSPIINGTAVYFELSKEIWNIWRGVVAVAFGVLPDVAAALAGFTAGKGMVKADTEPPLTGAEPKPKKKKAVEPAVIVEPAPVVVPVGHWETARPCPHCVASGAPLILDVNLFTNKAKFSGHTGKCKNNPARQFAEAAKEVR